MSEDNSLLYGQAINFIAQGNSTSQVPHWKVGNLLFVAGGWEEG